MGCFRPCQVKLLKISQKWVCLLEQFLLNHTQTFMQCLCANYIKVFLISQIHYPRYKGVLNITVLKICMASTILLCHILHDTILFFPEEWVTCLMVVMLKFVLSFI